MDRGLKTSNSNRQEFVEAIDNLFLKLELSYHYQFYKVFGTDQRLSEAKRLWAESLKKYPAASIGVPESRLVEDVRLEHRLN